MTKVLITGGAGFIGSNLVRYLLLHAGCHVWVLDKLTYAGQLASLADVQHHPRFRFCRGDVGSLADVRPLFAEFQPEAVVHLAAESHVDRSIDGPHEFLETNVMGTFRLLQAALEYYQQLPAERQRAFRFLQISTDEVYGSLPREGAPFTEESRYAPRSPYSASKAAADHLVRAWHETYGLPAMVSASSNNYGPCQYPEKLVPVVILRALRREPIPIYGSGEQIRDWLYVADHARAIWQILQCGQVGETYNVGGVAEVTNLELAQRLCSLLDELHPPPRELGSYRSLITHVADRPGHDWRYALDISKISTELAWTPGTELEQGLRATVQWYLENRGWWEPLIDQSGFWQRRGLGRHAADGTFSDDLSPGGGLGHSTSSERSGG